MGAQSLHRGLDLLELAIAGSSSIKELAERSILSKAIVYRLTTSLLDGGFLSKDENGRLRPGRKVLVLANSYIQNEELVRRAAPHLEDLSSRTGLCTFLDSQFGDCSLHLLGFAGRARTTISGVPGMLRPLRETAAGAALSLNLRSTVQSANAPPLTSACKFGQPSVCARYPDVIRHLDEPPDGIITLAAPIRRPNGEIAAAISVSATSLYLDEPRIEDISRMLIEACAMISADLS